jgi:uncharacterized protein YkwD
MRKQFAGIILGVIMAIAPGLEGCLAFNTSSEKKENQETQISANSRSLEQLEREIYQQVNQYRQSRNLPPLKWDDRITQQARMHSEKMSKKRVSFGHDGFEERAKAIRRDILYVSAAENVALNQGYTDPATQAVRGWIKSNGHRQNMEGKFDLTGVGVVRNAAGEYYFTQIFILRR